jgi:tetratricopeptide (TPR) repeat protein
LTVKKIYLILSISVLLFACGEKSKVENSQVAQVEEKSELDEINEQIASNPGSSNGFFRRAKYYAKMGEYALSLDDINRCIQIDPEVDFINLEKAKILMAQGRFSDAILYADIAVDKNPEYFEGYVLLGKLYFISGDYSKAFENLDKSLKIDKYKPEPYFVKGLVFETLKDSLKAATSYQTAIEQDADYFEAYFKLGSLYYARKPELAKQYLERAHEIIPYNMDVMRVLGNIFLEENNNERALEMFTKMTEYDPGYVETYLFLARTHINTLSDNPSKIEKDTTLAKAIANLDRAIELYPQYVQAYYLRGVCYEELGERGKSIKDYQKSLELDPQYELSNEALRNIDK